MIDEQYFERLIRMDEKLDNVTECVQKIEKKLDRQQEICSNRQTNCQNDLSTMVTQTWFHWVIGFVISGLLLLGGVAISSKVQVHQMEAEFSKHMEAYPAPAPLPHELPNRRKAVLRSM